MNADAMRDSFDYDTYWWIIERLSRTNRPLRFADVAGGKLPKDVVTLTKEEEAWTTR